MRAFTSGILRSFPPAFPLPPVPTPPRSLRPFVAVRRGKARDEWRRQADRGARFPKARPRHVLNPPTYLSGRINKTAGGEIIPTLMKIVASALTVPITAARTVD